MRGYLCHEKIKVYRIADYLCSQAGRDGRAGLRSLPQDRYQRSNILHLEKKYGGLGTAELRRLRQLEDENARLKQVVADLTLDKQMLQDVLKKKF
jgi:putative transposase